MYLLTIGRVFLLMLFLSPIAQSSSYFVVSQQSHAQSSLTLVEYIFNSAVEDEFSQTGFKILRSKTQVPYPEQTLLVFAELKHLGSGAFLPTLKLTDLVSGNQIASLRSDTIATIDVANAEITQRLKNTANALVRQATKRLYKKNWGNIGRGNLAWETEMYKLKLRFYSFDRCYLNYITDVIETEFPGTLALSMTKDTKNKAEFVVRTSAKSRFLSKWLTTLFSEEGFFPGRDYSFEMKKRFIDIRLHPLSSLSSTYC